jgi:dTDP-4-dehydrorhamnose reductase
MRILLTGASGQVGGALLPLLQGAHEVLAPTRAEFDLADPEGRTAALDRFNADLIINPAAYTAVDRAEDEKELAFAINAHAPAALASWAERHNVPLVHFSTDYVFDGSGETPWREEDTCRPLSSYGRSKWEGEKAIRASGAPHLIIRTSWVYAARGTNFLRTMARLAAERDELRVVADQFGAPTSASSIAAVVATILAQATSVAELADRFAVARGLVHVANSGTTTWHGFACAILDALKARGKAVKARAVHAIRTKDFPMKAMRPSNSRLDLSRLREVFGVKPPPWEQALQHEIDMMTEGSPA